MLRRYYKKTHFNFINNTAYLFLKRSSSNVFLTLADSDKKVIICKTAGLILKGSKRPKKSPFAIETIMKVLYPIISLYKIGFIKLVLRMRINIYYHTLLKELSFYGLQVINLSFNRRVAFNGVRTKKLRRI